MLLLALGVLPLLVTGCGGGSPLAEVEGTVALDGAPLENVLVSFLPDPAKGTDGPRSTGVCDAQGRFRLRCDDGREGAVVGWHRVVVEDLALYATPREEGSSPQPAARLSRVPPRYRAAATTPISVEVEPGPQTIPIELTTTP